MNFVEIRTSARLVLLSSALLAVAGCDEKGLTGGEIENVPPAFASAAECGTCHPDQLVEWERSRHAYSGVDPLMERLSVEAGEVVAEACVQCHAPAQRRLDLLMAAGSTRSREDLSADGSNCDVCHSISEIPPVADVSFLDQVDPSGPKYADMERTVDNEAHASERRQWYGTSIACAPCHQFNTGSGVNLENTFIEWEASSLAGMGFQCQDCHMPTYSGQAAIGAPVRDDLHRHDFVGVDYTYEPFRDVDLDRQKRDIADLLENSVSVTAEGIPPSVAAGDSFDIAIRVLNDRTGHSIPSGVSFAREMWIAVTVRDTNDNGLVYRSGWLEADDDLVSTATDPDLTLFSAQMYDGQGQPTGFAWLAESIDESGLLPYLASRTAEYTVDVPAGAVGPLAVELALRFRSLAPGPLRELGLDRILPIEIFDMWTESASVPVTP